MNWMRRAEQPSVVANALTSVVFATPGTPSSRACPRASRATSIVSTGSDDPMYTRATSRRTSSMRSRAAAISLVFAAAVTGSPAKSITARGVGRGTSRTSAAMVEHVRVARPIPASRTAAARRAPRQPALDARQGGQEARQGAGAALVEQARGPQARDELVGRGRAVEPQARRELLFEGALELEDREAREVPGRPEHRRVPGDAALRDDGHRAREPRRGVRVRLAGAERPSRRGRRSRRAAPRRRWATGDMPSWRRASSESESARRASPAALAMGDSSPNDPVVSKSFAST